MSLSSSRPTILLAAAGAAWEAGAIAGIQAAGGVLGKRCVDLTDLLATVAAGVGDVAVLGADLPGLDADAVRQLHGHQIAVLVIAEPDRTERMRRMGVAEVLVNPDPATIPAAAVTLASARDHAWSTDPDEGAVPRGEDESTPRLDDGDQQGQGRVVVVWGPTGAPGRTTLAVNLAAERAALGRHVILIDADPYGGAIGQNLGIIDEVSGLLAAARRVNEGELTADAFARCRRTVAKGLEVLTGLPRPDRWIEVRPGVLAQLIELAALDADVIVDVGFGLDTDRQPGRDRVTLEALDCADSVVVVAGAEPTSLVRLARGLVDLQEIGLTPGVVVINRMRDSLGWQRSDLVGMVTGYVWDAVVKFVREDRETIDKSLVAGRSLAELGEGRLRSDVRAVVGEVFGSGAEE